MIGKDVMEGIVLIDDRFFQMKHIRLILAAAERKGIDPETLKFSFGPRHDLSTVPYDLSAFSPQEIKELK